MIRAVLTRWNTIFDVIDRGLDIQPALDRLCLTSTGRASIKLLLLSNEEWQIMHQLHGVLKVRRVSCVVLHHSFTYPFYSHSRMQRFACLQTNTRASSRSFLLLTC